MNKNNSRGSGFDRNFEHLPFTLIPGGRPMRRENWPHSVTTTLIRFQMGVPFHRWEIDESIRYIINMNRQLVKSRAVQRRQDDDLEEEPRRKRRKQSATQGLFCEKAATLDLKMTWSCPTVDGLSKCSKERPRWTRIATDSSTLIVNRYIALKEGGVNTRRFYLPGHSLRSFPLELKYTLLDFTRTVKKWKDTDVWFVKPCLPPICRDGKIVRVTNTFLVLLGTKIAAYDFYKGNLLGDLNIVFDDGPPTYNDLNVDDESDQIFVAATSKKTGMEVLILDYPPLRVMYRIKFPAEEPWIGLTDFSNLGQVFVAIKSGRFELFDLEDLKSANTDSDTADSLKHPCMRTIVVKNQSDVLAKISSQTDFLDFIPCLHPPHILLKTKKQDVMLYNMDNPATPVHTFRSNGWDEFSVTCIDDSKPRFLLTGTNSSTGIEIAHFIPSENKTVTRFSSSNMNEILKNLGMPPTTSISSNDSTTPRRKEGLRRNSTVSYAEMEHDPVFGIGQDDDSDLLAVCQVLEGKLHTLILEADTLKPFMKLDPVELTIPKGCYSLKCSTVQVNLSEWFLMVSLRLYDEKKSGEITEVYVANLVGEVAADSL